MLCCQHGGHAIVMRFIKIARQCIVKRTNLPSNLTLLPQGHTHRHRSKHIWQRSQEEFLHDPGFVRVHLAKTLHATCDGDRQGLWNLRDLIVERWICDTILAFFYTVGKPVNPARSSSSSVFSFTIRNQASLYIFTASFRSAMHSLSAAIDAMAGRPLLTSLRLTCSRTTPY